MRIPVSLVANAAVFAVLSTSVGAAEFDRYGGAAPDLVAIQPASDFAFVLGVGIGTAPVYEGAAEYGVSFSPIIEVQRFRIPGLIDIGGGEDVGGLSFAPSFSIASKRVSAEHIALVGLNDVEATYALGARIGYELVLNDVLRGELYGAARYAVGGAEGFIGEAGVDITAKLTPQLEVVGGPMISFASKNYMDTYFGVTAGEAAATGGRLGAYNPNGGVKSFGVQLAARYEIAPDTFLSAKGSYSGFVGDALASPIVISGSQHQFTAGLGLARRFAF